jgi:DNA-binding transcriptional regulator YiaG
MTPAEIRSHREALGMTQGQIARLVGVDPRAWRSWEAGDRPFPASVELVLRAMTEVRGFRAWVERQMDETP